MPLRAPSPTLKTGGCEGCRSRSSHREILLNCQIVSPVGIDQQFELFIQDLARQALLAIEALVTQHENIIPKFNHEVEISSQRVNTVMSSVEERMRDFEVRLNEVKQSTMNTVVPLDIVNSLNDIIMEGAPSTSIKVIRG